METVTIGLDIAKSVFQVHGVDAQGDRRRSPAVEAPTGSALLREAGPCLIGIEACATPIIGRAS